MAYQCEIQKETTKTMVFCTNYKGKDKILILQRFNSSNDLQQLHFTWWWSDKVIWSDGPNSEYKNQFMCFLIQELSINKSFIWKFSATSHGKYVVDSVGEKKSLVYTRKLWVLVKIIEGSESFAKLEK